MRRVTGLILAGLGIVLIAAAVLLPTYVSSQVVKFPLGEDTTATLASWKPRRSNPPRNRPKARARRQLAGRTRG